MKNLKQMVCVFAVVLLGVTAMGSIAKAGALNRASLDIVSTRINAQANMLAARANAQANMLTARANAQANVLTAQANARSSMITGWIEAQAKMLTARAAMITAIANARESNAKTMQTLQQVRGLSLDNNLKTAKTFYEKRKLHKDYMASKTRKRPSKEDVSRYSKASLPKRPADYQLQPDQNKIYWPHVLQEERFLEYREQLESLFARRGAGSGITNGTYQQVRTVAEGMRADLRSMIRQTAPVEYLEARKFIDSLVLESRFPKRIEGIAANCRQAPVN